MSAAQKSVLKSLARKMQKVEMDQYESGKTDEKPEPVKKEMKETKNDKEKTPEVDDQVKKMVRQFFKKDEGKSEDEVFTVPIEFQKPSIKKSKVSGTQRAEIKSYSRKKKG